MTVLKYDANRTLCEPERSVKSSDSFRSWYRGVQLLLGRLKAKRAKDGKTHQDNVTKSTTSS